MAPLVWVEALSCSKIIFLFFSLNNKKKEERIKFCQKILDMNLKGQDLFFIDESQMDCNPFVNEHIRLSPENQEKMKNEI